jgi:hypothetical protein
LAPRKHGYTLELPPAWRLQDGQKLNILANLLRKCCVPSTSVVLIHAKEIIMKRLALALERLQGPRLLDAQPYPLRF